MTETIRLNCKSTLGKRTRLSLCAGDARKSELSITLAPTVGGLQANCWLRDTLNHQVGFQVTGESLRTLRDALINAVAEQDQLERR